jgi:molybdopterin-guanine dinucleotide biosynthesis protein A
MEDPLSSYAAVVLAGGTGERLGGVDKAALVVDGRTLLDHALASFAGAGEVVVVGDERPAPAGVRFVREDPPYGGPAAGLLAGRDALTTDPAWLAVLAVDMPHVTATTWRRLAGAAGDHDGAALVDADGRRQLALLVRTGRLDEVRPAETDRLAVHRLLAPLDLVGVPAEGREARDLDHPSDLPPV